MQRKGDPKECLCVCSSVSSECLSRAGQLSDLCVRSSLPSLASEQAQEIQFPRKEVTCLSAEAGAGRKVVLYFGKEAGISRALGRALIVSAAYGTSQLTPATHLLPSVAG